MTSPVPTDLRNRPWHCLAHLIDFAIITFDVDLAAVSARLPAGFVPQRFCVDGKERGLISAVIFQDRDFHFRGIPFASMNCVQVNYRAYVQHDGELGVWFFGTSLGHRLVAVAQLAWGMPWHRDSMRLSVAWDGDRMLRYDFESNGPWGVGQVQLVGEGRPAGLLAGMPDLQTQHRVLLDPFVGWYQRRGLGPYQYQVRHAPLAPLQATVKIARFDVFDRLGLVTMGQLPLHAVTQRKTLFDVLTPPRRCRRTSQSETASD